VTLNVKRLPVHVRNFAQGRQGHDPDVIVIHVTQGTEAGTRQWFNDPRSGVSTHYHLTKDADVDQFVDEDDTAFGNGKRVNPTAPIVLERPRVNPNLYTISIEHEGNGRVDLNDAQFSNSVSLICDIIARRPKIKPTRRHIIRHDEIRDDKACPGKIDVDAIVEAVNLRLGQRPPIPGIHPVKVNRVHPPVMVWSDFFGGGDWLIVTKVVSDEEWYFVRYSQLKSGGMVAPVRAQTPLSEMPKV
jgi:hypothetical protein